MQGPYRTMWTCNSNHSCSSNTRYIFAPYFYWFAVHFFVIWQTKVLPKFCHFLGITLFGLNLIHIYFWSGAFRNYHSLSWFCETIDIRWRQTTTWSGKTSNLVSKFKFKLRLWYDWFITCMYCTRLWCLRQL